MLTIHFVWLASVVVAVSATQSTFLRNRKSWPRMDGLHMGGGSDTRRYGAPGTNSGSSGGAQTGEGDLSATACSCACCTAYEASDAWSCRPPASADARCPVMCHLGCETVLQSTQSGLVDMSRFCLFDCKPYGHRQGAGCVTLSPDDVAARLGGVTGNGKLAPADPGSSASML
jgi:hypothetical protein